MYSLTETHRDTDGVQVLKKIRPKDADLKNEFDSMKAALAEDTKQVSVLCDYFNSFMEISIDDIKLRLNSVVCTWQCVSCQWMKKISRVAKLLYFMYVICKRKLNSVSIGKSNVIVFEKEEWGINFAYPYRVRTECQKHCAVRLNGQLMEKGTSFNILVPSFANMKG